MLLYSAAKDVWSTYNKATERASNLTCLGAVSRAGAMANSPRLDPQRQTGPLQFLAAALRTDVASNLAS